MYRLNQKPTKPTLHKTLNTTLLILVTIVLTLTIKELLDLRAI